jgi:HSP20 family protein
MALAKYQKPEEERGLSPWGLYSGVERLFDDFFGVSRDLGFPALGRSWAPAVDIEETEADYRLKAELPGLRKEDVKISVEDNVLTLSGERREEKTEKNRKVHRVERSYGSFTRSFSLPSSIAADKVTAAYKDGVLEIVVPKREEARPRQVEIKVD